MAIPSSWWCTQVDDLSRDGNFTTISCPAPAPKFDYPVIQYFEDSTEAPAKPHGGPSSSSGASNPTNPPAPMDLSERLKYRLPYTKDLLKSLQDDKINMIGISGIFREIDTVSTKEFIKRMKHRNLFEEVVMAVVSQQDPDLKRIQGEIADMLHLKLENGSLVERTERLRAAILDSKRLLLILADVWKLPDLEAIGISRGDKRCKIVLISQLQSVFSEMTNQRNFELLLQSPPVARPVEFESRVSVIRDVMDALTDDESNPIVLCGMGGIGKTTLVMEIGAKASEVDLFDDVAFAEFTHEPDLDKIRGKIAKALGLELTADDDRAAKLRERISGGTKRVLLILDNIWTQQNLWEVGIPISRHPKSCKLLVSSRNQDIFKEMKTRKNFPVGGLPKEDAWSLFQKVAGGSIECDPELRPIAEQVLDECDGLPVAITTVGRALQGENIPKWRDALRQLKKACPEDVPGVIEHVYGKIEFSYECLPSEQAKSCFLLCCVFPESEDLPIEDLVRFGLGLGLFRRIDSIAEGRDCVKSLVDILKKRSLLLDGKDKNYVRMHDVVRDVAVYIASEELTKKKNDQLQKRNSVIEESTYCTSLATSTGGRTELLLLRSDGWGLKTELPVTIFNGMEDLKVLLISNSTLPSLPLLKNLQTLILYNCHLNLDAIGELRTLMILKLSGFDVQRLPDTFKNLSNLRMLDLTGCDELKTIALGVISRLSRLEELYMWDSFEDWVVEKLASKETTNWISQLEDQESRKEDVSQWEDQEGSEEEVVHWRKRFKRLAVEKLASTSQLEGEERSEPDWISQLEGEERSEPERISQLEDQESSKEEVVHKWKRFKRLAVEKLASTSQLEDEEEDVSQLEDEEEDVSQLEDEESSKKVVDMWKRFNRLAVEKLASTSQLEGEERSEPEELVDLGQLYREEVVNSYREDEHTKWANSMDWTVGILSELLSLSRLTTLQVFLPPVDILLRTSKLFHKLERFKISIGWDQSTELNLEDYENYLRVADLDASSLAGTGITLLLKKTNALELQLKNLTDPLNVLDTDYCCAKLEYLKLENCDALEYLIDMTLMEHTPRSVFPVLKHLDIYGASRLKEIFHGDLPQGSLQKLKTLDLFYLPALTYVWKVESQSGCLGNLAHVERIRIQGCESLEAIFGLVGSGHHEEGAAPEINFLSLTSLTLEDLPSLTGMSNSNDKGMARLPEVSSLYRNSLTVEHSLFFDPKVYFPVLTHLYIEGLGNLKEIWNCQLSLNSFCELTNLTVMNCDKLLHLVPTHMQNRLQKLGSIWVQYCSSLEEIFEVRRLTVNEGDASTITQSKKIPSSISQPDHGMQINNIMDFKQSRQGLGNLKEIWNKQLSLNSFCELKGLTVMNCDKLLHLVPTHMQNRLQKLGSIWVHDCSSLEEIFEVRRLTVNEGDASTISQSKKIPSSISQPDHGMQINNSMDFKQSRQGFQNLTSLQVTCCHSLRYLLSPSIARGLVRLERLYIEDCEKIEEIVAAAEGDEREDESILPRLKDLELRDLPNLGSFSQGKYTFEWPLVKDISIRNCSKMNNFCLGSLSLPRKVSIIVRDSGENNLEQELKNCRK